MNTQDIVQNKTELTELVRAYGFFEVCDASEIAPATLGLYLDESNERYLSPRSLKLARLSLLK